MNPITALQEFRDRVKRAEIARYKQALLNEANESHAKAVLHSARAEVLRKRHEMEMRRRQGESTLLPYLPSMHSRTRDELAREMTQMARASRDSDQRLMMAHSYEDVLDVKQTDRDMERFTRIAADIKAHTVAQRSAAFATQKEKVKFLQETQQDASNAGNDEDPYSLASIQAGLQRAEDEYSARQVEMALMSAELAPPSTAPVAATEETRELDSRSLQTLQIRPGTTLGDLLQSQGVYLADSKELTKSKSRTRR